jgi:hypothetical protein
MWQAQNIVDREIRDNQQVELAEAPRLQQEEHWLEEEEQQHALDEEKELAKQEEWKKNHTKFLTYNKVPISTKIIRLPLPIATHKLKKGDYVELYYFTNKGLAEAEASTRSTDNCYKPCFPLFIFSFFFMSHDLLSDLLSQHHVTCTFIFITLVEHLPYIDSIAYSDLP